jgi:hypothetical protein
VEEAAAAGALEAELPSLAASAFTLAMAAVKSTFGAGALEASWAGVSDGMMQDEVESGRWSKTSAMKKQKNTKEL